MGRRKPLPPRDAPCPECGEVHDPTKCRAHRKSDGLPCTNRPIAGGVVCNVHGGRVGHTKAAARRRLALAEIEREVNENRIRLGVPPDDDVEPAEAMAAMIAEAAGNVAVYRWLVQGLGLKVDDPTVSGGGPLGLGAGLAVQTGSRAKLNDAAPHVWVTMYDAERERLVRWSKWAREAGVDERRQEIAVEVGQALARSMLGMSEALLVLVFDLVQRDAGPELAGEVRRLWTTSAPGVMREQLTANVGAATGTA